MGGYGPPGRETGGGYCSIWLVCLLALPLLMLSGCTTVPVYGDVPECERLIPESLKADVPGVPIPESEEAEAWMQAFVGQTGQLDKANERPDAVDHIYRTCLDLHRNALNKAKRRWWQIF